MLWMPRFPSCLSDLVVLIVPGKVPPHSPRQGVPSPWLKERITHHTSAPRSAVSRAAAVCALPRPTFPTNERVQGVQERAEKKESSENIEVGKAEDAPVLHGEACRMLHRPVQDVDAGCRMCILHPAWA